MRIAFLAIANWQGILRGSLPCPYEMFEALDRIET